MTRSSDLKDKFSDDDKQKLTFFLQGSSVNGCMSSDPSYTPLNNIAQSLTYRKYVPGLELYIADGGVKWAEQLYDHYTKGPNWTVFRNTVQQPPCCAGCN